jgi:N-sulfoglucosamine sulfohydrolase
VNVIYMNTHDTGRYIEPYGYSVPTPNLMKLAEQGTLFRNMYSAAPTCSPSRVGMLTGMAPHSSGLLGLAHRGFKMKEPDRHLAAFMRKNGFETALCGVQHEHANIHEMGYEKDLMKGIPADPDFIKADISRATRAAQYIKENNSKNTPYFLSVGLVNTHRKKRDFPTDEKVNPNYVQPPFPLPDTPETRQDMADYISSANVVDQCVGIVMEALEQSGSMEDTIFIFTTDHGIPFPHMKCNLFDTGIGVSFILKEPGNQRKGEVVDSLVSHLDVFPTLCDLLQLDKPEWLQGKSMVPLLNKETESINDQIYAEVTFHAAYEPIRCVRTERYKLIKFYDNHHRHVMANIDDSLSKEFLLNHDLLEQHREPEMLYDLYFDPTERNNLVNDDNYIEIYKGLSDRLDRWMKETADPLLAGKVIKPEDAVVNTLSCISPEEEKFE